MTEQEQQHFIEVINRLTAERDALRLDVTDKETMIEGLRMHNKRLKASRDEYRQSIDDLQRVAICRAHERDKLAANNKILRDALEKIVAVNHYDFRGYEVAREALTRSKA